MLLDGFVVMAVYLVGISSVNYPQSRSNQFAKSCNHCWFNTKHTNLEYQQLRRQVVDRVTCMPIQIFLNQLVTTLKQLCAAFIHPHLEYATTDWDPHLSKDIQEL